MHTCFLFSFFFYCLSNIIFICLNKFVHLMEGGSSINASKILLNAIPADPIYINYHNPAAADTPNEDQPQDTSRKGYFLEKDLHSTTKMKMHFRITTNKATFLPRQVADSIPFSSNKLLEILSRFSLKQDSEEARLMKETIQNCERPPPWRETPGSAPHPWNPL